ncbi:hypothetical protein [Komagataeibacter saccharivorans]|uniref:hypothetical protein n=1 Tax=Komagataeibacter saccharivorans TaxID=265959 RepID=UPI000C86826F|nr:hypothetical protein [Komagataeibacter saccharivorans]
MNALSRLIRWRDGDLGPESVMEDIHTLGRIGSRLWDEIQKRGVNRKNAIGDDKVGARKPLTKSDLCFLAGRSSDYAMDYLAGHQPCETVWQTVTEYVQTVDRMIADREGKSRPPAALQLMVPGCEVSRERELIG